MKDTNGIDNDSLSQPTTTTLDLVLDKLRILLQNTIDESTSSGGSSQINRLEGALEPNVKISTQCIQYILRSESFTKICHHLKILHTIKDISREQIQDLLCSCRRNFPEVNCCNTEDLAVFSYGNDPDLFYLKWIKNIQPCKLLLYWLTEMEQTNQLDALAYDSPIDLINHLVVVEFDVDSCWYRAKVIQYQGATETEEEKLQCFFIDYGNTEWIETSKLRRLPDELVTIPPFIFQAKLDFSDTEIIPNDDFPPFIKFKCVQKLKSYGMMKCQVTRLEDTVHQVKLWCNESSTYLASEVVKDKRKFDVDQEDYYFDEGHYEIISESHALPDESKLLCHKNGELGIMENTEPTLLNQCTNYKITKVVNPDLFYVVDQNYSKEYLHLQQRMAEFYSDENWIESYKIRTSRVFCRRIYAWSNNGIWERVKVDRVDMPKGKVYVYRLDFLEYAIVNISDMMEFNPKFCMLPSQCHRAHLAHVIPSKNQEDWSPEAIEMLKEIFRMDQLFFGITMSSVKVTYLNGTRKLVESRALILRPTSPDLQITVQSILVALEVAEGTGIGAGHLDLIYSRMTYPNDSYSLSNNGWVTNAIHRGRRRRFGRFKNGLSKLYCSNYSAQPLWNQAPLLSRESILTSKTPGTLLGDTEELKSYESRRVKTWQRAHFRKNHQKNTNTKGLPDEIRKNLGEIVFCHINGPGNFYVRMAYKEVEFGKMVSLLTEKAEESEQLSKESIYPGLFVTAMYLNEDFVPTWQRGFVNETSPEVSNAKVILIDIGVEILVKYYYLRALPQEFLHVPPFCRRAHILISDFMPCGISSWTSAANINFKKYVEAWKITNPTYFAYIPSFDQDPIRLNYFNEDLKFCRIKNEWIADELKPWMCQGEANSQKSHPLLVHLFSSLGLVIWYENKVDEDSDLHSRNFNKPLSFSAIWDNLFDSGFVHPVPEG